MTEKSNDRRLRRKLNSRGVMMLIILIVVMTTGFSANAYQGFLAVIEWKATVEKHMISSEAHGLGQVRHDVSRVEKSLDRVEHKIDALLIDRGIPRDLREDRK